MAESRQVYRGDENATGDSQPNGAGGFFHSLRSILSRTRWLGPLSQSALISGADFGRNIQKVLGELGEPGNPGVLAVSIRKKLKAVVITPEHYQEMLQMREKFEALVSVQAASDVEDAKGHFDMLYHRITSEPARAASEALFSVTGEDLANSYRPGGTESDE